MKRILSFALSLLLLLTSIPMVVLAEENTEDNTEEKEELYNVAYGNPNAMSYASSEKNTLWTPAAALNDGKKSADTWQGWECAYPNIIYGANTSAGFSGEYCGIKFKNRQYYEIHEIHFNIGLHSAMGGQNPHYLVQCLVEGVWVTVGEFNDSDTIPCVTNSDGSLKFSSYEDAMANDTSNYHIGSNYSIKLETPVTTNNIRVTVSGFAKNFPGGDVLIFPYVYEIEPIGKLGEAPELELPEGAVISTNIAYHSFPYASSSMSFCNPYCVIDGVRTTKWSPMGKKAGEYLTIKLSEAKKVNKVVLNFGEYMSGMAVEDYAFDIEALINGEWVKLSSGTALDEENSTLITEYTFAEVETKEVRVIFTEKYSIRPTIYEFEVHMSEEKTYYVEDRFDAAERNSAAKGNIAIVGTPYASLDFEPYSSIEYINDGKNYEGAKSWFTGVIDMPSYCGIRFDEKQLINKVAVYVAAAAIEGEDSMSIHIQALIDGEYVTLVSSKSYDKKSKYTTVYEFDAVETDDIRILYTTGSGTFANIRELEIYSPNGMTPMFEGTSSFEKEPDTTTNVTSAHKELVNSQLQDIASLAFFGMSSKLVAEIKK